MTTRHRRAWAHGTRQAVLVAFITTLAAYASPLLLGLQTFDLDATAYDLPILCGARRALAAAGAEGSWWVSRLYGGGSALAAEVGTVPFYPPRWIVWLLDPGVGRTIDVAVHLALGAAGVTLLARSFGVRPIFAGGAGLVFAATGPVVDLLKHSAIYAAGAGWAPWIWAFARLSRRPGARLAPVALAACTALTMLSGDLQAWAVACLVVALESVVLFARRRSVPELARVAVGGIVGALIGAVQPTLVLGEIPLSRRAAGLPTHEVLAGALDLVTLPGLVLPNALGVAVDDKAWAIRAGGVTWLEASYVSAALLALVVAGMRQRRPRAALVVATVLFVLALGPATPAGPFLVERLPGADQLRYAAKLLPFALAAAVVVAAAALERSGRARARWRTSLVVGAVGGGAIVMAAVVVSEGQVGAAAVGLVRGIVALGAVVALLVARRPVWAGAVIVIDVAWAAAVFAPFGPPLLDAPGLLTNVPPSVVVCVPPRTISQVSLPTGSADARWAAAAARRAYDSPGLGACDDVVTAPAYQTLQPGLGLEMEIALSDDVPAAPVALGCTHQLSVHERAGRPWLSHQPHPDVDAVADAGPGRPRLYAVADALPLASVARAPRLCPDEDCTLRALVLAPRGKDVHNLVDDPLRRLAVRAPLPDGAGATASAARVNDQRIDVALQGTGGAVVVVRQPLLVGTTATQAGRSLPVVRAAGHLIGVVVDDVTAGPVVVDYAPPGFAPGAALSATGAVLFVVLSALTLRRRRR